MEILWGIRQGILYLPIRRTSHEKPQRRALGKFVVEQQDPKSGHLGNNGALGSFCQDNAFPSQLLGLSNFRYALRLRLTRQDSDFLRTGAATFVRRQSYLGFFEKHLSLRTDTGKIADLGRSFPLTIGAKLYRELSDHIKMLLTCSYGRFGNQTGR